MRTQFSDPGWASIRDAAHLAGASEPLVRKWAERGVVESKLTADGRRLVHVPTLARRVATTRSGKAKTRGK